MWVITVEWNLFYMFNYINVLWTQAYVTSAKGISLLFKVHWGYIDIHIPITLMATLYKGSTVLIQYHTMVWEEFAIHHILAVVTSFSWRVSFLTLPYHILIYSEVKIQCSPWLFEVRTRLVLLNKSKSNWFSAAQEGMVDWYQVFSWPNIIYTMISLWQSL